MSRSSMERLAVRTAWCAVAATLFLAAAVRAQEPPEARLHVTVVDQTGGRIPEAMVSVSGIATPRAKASPAPGVFELSLPAGKYSVTAEADGFAPASVDVELAPGAPKEVSIRLQVAVKQSVTVQSLRLQSLKGRILTAEDLKLLPNNEAEMRYMLLELAGSRGRPGDVAIYVDGFSDFHRLPSKAAIDLIQINAEPYSAEFAEPGTRRIEIITKPGAEGAFGEFKADLNDESLNATQSFADSKPPVQRRTFSGYYSAPIIPNRWGFYAYAGRWEQDENAVINATVLNLVPEPSPFVATLPAPFRENNLTFNSGYALANQMRLMTEYSRNTAAGENQGLRDGGFRLPEQAFIIDNVSHTGRLSLLSVIGTRTVHELRLRVSDARNTSSALNRDPAIMVLDSFTSGGNQESRLVDDRNAALQLDTKLTRSFGRHTVNTGLQLDRLSRTVVNEADFGGTFVFGADTDRDEFGFPINDGEAQITPIENYRRTITFVPGYTPTLFTITTGDPRAARAQVEFAAYAQSDYRPSDSLTLSYGVRYEAQTNLSDRGDLAPRTGVAWRLRGDTGLIRAGAGVFYDRVDLNLTLDPLRRDPTRLQRYVVLRPDFYSTGVPGFLITAATEQTFLTKSPDMRAARRLISNASYERELPWTPLKTSLFGSVGYTWERAGRLPRVLDTNAPLLPELPRPNAGAGQMLLYDSIGRSARHELQMSLRTSFSDGSRVFANYSLAQTKSDTDSIQDLPSNSYDLAAEYGAAQADERHRLFVSGNFGLPGAWILAPSFTASSGRPFNIVTGLDNNNDTHLTDRPAFADAADADAVLTPWGLLDPTPERGEVVIPRNYGRGATQFKADLMIMKIFALSKTQPNRSVSLTFNVDNVFNRTNRRDFNGVLVSPVFGRANTAQPKRRVSLGFVFSF